MVDALAENRATAAIFVAATIVGAGSAPVYFGVGEATAQLRELEMSDNAIARGDRRSASVTRPAANSQRQRGVPEEARVVPRKGAPRAPAEAEVRFSAVVPRRLDGRDDISAGCASPSFPRVVWMSQCSF